MRASQSAIKLHDPNTIEGSSSVLQYLNRKDGGPPALPRKNPKTPVPLTFAQTFAAMFLAILAAAAVLSFIAFVILAWR